MTSDLDLLKKFTRENSQDAFSEIVRRHLDLLYSAALRQVRLPTLAEEIAQSVFADLAHNAGKLKPDTILTAWLYAVTRRTAIDVVRKESRRRLREQIAVEMNNMNATADEWMQIAPLLDDAMSALDETDRSAILLRYFENKNLREVGEALGASEDAAQKRVSSAVERLREFFSKRNIAIGASGLAVLISANAVQSAPVGLAAAISTAAVLAGTTVSTSTAIATTKVVAMTTLQKSIIGAALAATVGTGIFEAHQTSQLRSQVQTLQQQQAPLAEQIRQLQRERDDATNQLAGLLAENQQLQSDQNETELLKLRGEVTQLQAAKIQEEKNPMDSATEALSARASQLKEYANQNPNVKIPEMQLMSNQDWLMASVITRQFYTNYTGVIETEDEYRRAMAQVRNWAEMEFVGRDLQPALKGYEQANNGQFPTSISELQPYFTEPVDATMLQRYEILPATQFPGVGGSSVITEKAPIDSEYDARTILHADGSYGSRWPDSWSQ